MKFRIMKTNNTEYPKYYCYVDIRNHYSGCHIFYLPIGFANGYYTLDDAKRACQEYANEQESRKFVEEFEIFKELEI